MLPDLLALSVIVSVIALVYARWEYRKRGKLSLFGLFLLCLMLFVPNVLLEYATSYNLPDSPLDYFGVVISALGLVLCLVSIVFFCSPAKVMCIDTGTLTVMGPYRWSRNPQYVGWVMFLLGFSMTDWSLWCLAAVLVVAVSLHLLVLVEEEHLARVFGESYDEFCRKVPRYLANPF